MSLEHLRGKFIVVEGIDQAGKQTITKWLHQTLIEQGIPAHLTEYPRYDTPIGGLIRSILADPNKNPRVLQLLMAADKWDDLARIEKHLKDGCTSIADRYVASGIVYGASDGLPAGWVGPMNRGLLVPDITILLEISAAESNRRKPEGRDSYEADLLKLAEVAGYYRALAAENDWIITNGELAPDVVKECILFLLEQMGERV
jgi:dTMP kinase